MVNYDINTKIVFFFLPLQIHFDFQMHFYWKWHSVSLWLCQCSRQVKANALNNSTHLYLDQPPPTLSSPLLPQALAWLAHTANTVNIKGRRGHLGQDSREQRQEDRDQRTAGALCFHGWDQIQQWRSCGHRQHHRCTVGDKSRLLWKCNSRESSYTSTTGVPISLHFIVN